MGIGMGSLAQTDFDTIKSFASSCAILAMRSFVLLLT
jgi:hypothetical protein